MRKNYEFKWDDFSPQLYFESNYQFLHQDDKRILKYFYTFLGGKQFYNTMLDVGSGSNLLPFLTAAPFVNRVTLSDFAAVNCDWLKNQVGSTLFERNWSEALEFLERLSSAYNRTEILKRIENVSVQEKSVFDLPNNQFDLCTMFFCIESVTNSATEFALGIDQFLGAVRSQGMFFAVMMRNSKGYKVGEIQFPAYKFSIEELQSLVSQKSEDFKIIELDATPPLIRDGFDGFVVIQGNVK